MTRRITLAIAAVTSDDGTRCADDCPHLNVIDGFSLDDSGCCDETVACCMEFDFVRLGDMTTEAPTHEWRRHPACLAAEQEAREAEASAMERGFESACNDVYAEGYPLCGGGIETTVVTSFARQQLKAELARIRGGKSS